MVESYLIAASFGVITGVLIVLRVVLFERFMK
jgi:hypothetical protein